MTFEFTFYTLFVLLCISTGVVFQFSLAQIKKIKRDLLKMNKSISNIHSELITNREQPKKSMKNPRSTRYHRKNPRVISGCLELEHQGSRAQTNATFYIKEEK